MDNTHRIAMAMWTNAIATGAEGVHYKRMQAACDARSILAIRELCKSNRKMMEAIARSALNIIETASAEGIEVTSMGGYVG